MVNRFPVFSNAELARGSNTHRAKRELAARDTAKVFVLKDWRVNLTKLMRTTLTICLSHSGCTRLTT